MALDVFKGYLADSRFIPFYTKINLTRDNLKLNMPILLYPVCWRSRTDCEPIQCIDAAPEDATQEQLETLNYTPESFVCSGCVSSESRVIAQDIYRVCFKNSFSDEMSDNDTQDLSSLAVVITSALSLDSIRKRNSGILEIPDVLSKDVD